MKININLLIILVVFSAFSCCKKPWVEPEIIKPKRDIYTLSGLPDATTVWKNGEVFIQREARSFAGDNYYMFVENNDVYTSNPRGEIWKNNQNIFNINLDIESTIRSIFVSKGDVYSVGQCSAGIAVYKNSDTLYIIPSGVYDGVRITYVNAGFIYVNGTDVYIAGSEFITAPFPLPRIIIWKNGIEHFSFSTQDYPRINAMCGVGEDIYLAAINANTYEVEVLKNRQYLFSVGTNAGANSISVDGNNVYVAGTGTSPYRPLKNAVVWKNGDVLYNNLDVEETKHSEANSVVAIDSDVYVSGYCEADKRYLCTWKNGKLLYKYEGYSSSGANKLFVK